MTDTGKVKLELTQEERALVFSALEMAWYQQPVQDSAGAELKGKWRDLMEKVDKAN